MAKCRRNVENFLDACKKMGVPQVIIGLCNNIDCASYDKERRPHPHLDPPLVFNKDLFFSVGFVVFVFVFSFGSMINDVM